MGRNPNDYNGPILPMDPPARPEMHAYPGLTMRASYEELANNYAAVALDNAAHRGAVYRELDEMRAAIILLDSRFNTRINAAVEEIAKSVRSGLPPPASGSASAMGRFRHSSPSFVGQPLSMSEYGADFTPGHGVRLDQEAWGRLQLAYESMQREKEEQAQKAHDAEMKRKGAEEHAAVLLKASDLRMRNLKKWIAIGGAVLAALEGLSRVFLH